MQKEKSKKSANKATLSWLWSQTRGLRAKMVFLMVGTCLYAGTSALFALACRGTVDAATSFNKDGIIRYGLALVMIIVFQLIMRLVLNAMEEYISTKLGIALRRGIFKQILKKEYSDVRAYHSGELLNRMFSDVSVVVTGITTIVPSLLSMGTRIVCAVVVLIYLAPGLTLVFVVGGLSLFGISTFFRGGIKRLHKDVQTKEGRMRAFLQETLENILMIKVFGVEEKMKETDAENEEQYFKSRMKRRTLSIYANAGFSFVYQAGYLFALLWGCVGLFRKTITFGTQTAILQLVNQIQAPFATLSSVMPKYYTMLASAERIMEIENIPDEEAACEKADYSDFESIEVKNLDFSYGENHVIKDSTFTINRGDFTAITGLSGGGKTTLFHLLLGVYKPQEGDVLMHMKSGKTFVPGIASRPLFAYVPQGNFLFSGTVRENIAFINPDASEDDIRKCAKTACALEFIEELPDGFETKVGENGFGLSEGQAQRIAIARALLSGSRILLLDEATSALDGPTEAQVLENIRNLKDFTLMIVTHRPAALDICTGRLVMEEGHFIS